MKKKTDHIIGSGNVFADLGFANPEEMSAKADLAYEINKLIKKKKLTQIKAAELLDIDQPKISALARGKLSGFSLERLFRFLNILGQDITIKITPKSRSKKSVPVSVTLPKSSPKLPALRKERSLNSPTLQAKIRK